MKLGEIYKNNLNEIITNGIITPSCTDPLSIGSHFGIKSRFTKEIIGKSFVIKNARERVIYCKHSNINYTYLLANLLYLISGEKKIEMIQFYNEKGKMFSDDGINLNASMGYRIFEFDQIRYVIEVLTKDLSSRRAIIQISSSQDTIVKTKDFPCLNYIQFLYRENKLVMVVNMRSQSAMRIFPYDYFLFSMLHEIIALRLNYVIGEIVYFCGSLHIYNDEFETAKNIANNSMQSLVMNKIDDFSDLQRGNILRAEKALRSGYRTGKFKLNDLESFSLSPFWLDYLKCLYNCLAEPAENANNFKKLLSKIDKVSLEKVSE